MSTAYATMPVLPDEKVKLQDIVCQFHFISAPDEIKQLLQSFPPKISIYDTSEGDELSLLTFDVKPLFYQEKVILMLYLQKRFYRIIEIKTRIFFSPNVSINYLCLIQTEIKLLIWILYSN